MLHFNEGLNLSHEWLCLDAKSTKNIRISVRVNENFINVEREIES